MGLEFEDILKECGNYGRHQQIMVWGLLVPYSFLMSFALSTVIFQVVVPEHWCHVPGRDNTSFSIEEWKNITIPRSENGLKFESCSHYNYDPVNDTFLNSTNVCTNGWEFDNSIFRETVATSWNWFCSKEEYSTHILTVRFAGRAAGSIILPMLADKYTGKKLMFFITLLMSVIFNVPLTWIKQPAVHLLFRFLSSTCVETNYQLCYVTVLELIAADKRAFASALSFFAWAIGMCFTSLIAWIFPQWQILNLISSVPPLLAIFFWKLFPESPRWLLSQNRSKECAEVLRQVAEMNGKKFKFNQVKDELDGLVLYQNKNSGLFRETIKYPRICLHVGLLIITSVTALITYACVVLNINVIPNQYFLNFFILSLIEVPSNFTGWLGAQYIGRRFTGIGTYFLCALFALLGVFYVQDKITLLVIASMLKLLSNQAIFVFYLYISEVLPTPIRSTGMGTMLIPGTIFMIVSPYIVHSDIGETFQYWIIFVLMIIGTIASIFMPETLGLPLPQTFLDAQNIGIDRPFRSWVNHWNKQ